MQQFVQRHRWSVLAAGALIQICTGVPAAWGVFQQGVQDAYGYSQADTALVLSFVICFFGIGCVLGGAWQDKCGPRTVGLCGAALLGGGFIGASFLPQGLPWLFYLVFAVPVGLGCAFMYPGVMAAVQKWYADKKGFATGIVGGAVGLSGAALTLAWQGLLGALGARWGLAVLGGSMALLCGACACFMVNPAEAPQQDAKTKHLKNYSPRQMLRTRQYWLLTAVVALATPSVLLFSPVVVQLGQERGLPQELALLSVMIGSVLSAAGRLGMPWLSDKIGRRYTDMILLAGLAAFSVAFIFAQSGWFIAVYCLLTFCYSGQAAVLPATCTDLYGPRHTGINYGLLALGMSAGSVAFGVLARCLNDLWPRHLIAIAAPLLGVVLLIFIKPTQTKRL